MIEAWAYIGTAALGLLAYQDIKHNCFVDERINYFMYGLTTWLMMYSEQGFWSIFPPLFLLLFALGYLTINNNIGEGDFQSIFWMGAGILSVSQFSFLMFLIFFLIFLSLFQLGMLMFHIKSTWFYPCLLILFIFCCLSFGYYII